MDEKSRFCELSTEEIQEMLENAIPTSTKKATNFGLRLFNGDGSELKPFTLQVERFLGKSISEIQTSKTPMIPALLGECLAHTGAINMAVNLGEEGFASCDVMALLSCGRTVYWRRKEEMKLFQTYCCQWRTHHEECSAFASSRWKNGVKRTMTCTSKAFGTRKK